MDQISRDEIKVVGYGTFITLMAWSKRPSSKVVVVNDHARVMSKRNDRYPYVIPASGSSFKGILFVVDSQELRGLDRYEGTGPEPTNEHGYGLYFRKMVTVTHVDGTNDKAWIYIPTKETIKRERLVLGEDKWLEVIKSHLKRTESKLTDEERSILTEATM